MGRRKSADTPAPPTKRQVRAIINGLCSRRAAAGDPSEELIPTSPGAMLDFLLDREGRRVDDEVLKADVRNGLVILRHFAAYAERDLYRLGRNLGMSWADMTDGVWVRDREVPRKRSALLEQTTSTTEDEEHVPEAVLQTLNSWAVSNAERMTKALLAVARAIRHTSAGEETVGYLEEVAYRIAGDVDISVSPRGLCREVRVAVQEILGADVIFPTEHVSAWADLKRLSDELRLLD